MARKGKRITAAEKRLIDRVRRFMEKERDDKHRVSLTKVTERLAAATRISKRKQSDIHQESLATGDALRVPRRRRVLRKQLPQAIKRLPASTT